MHVVVLRKLFLAPAHCALCMAKKAKKAKDENFERIKKIIIILAFIIGFAAMTFFILKSA
jgi:hypothetical protein